MLASVKALRPQVDVVIVSLHWGVQYVPVPTKKQVEMAHAILERSLMAWILLSGASPWMLFIIPCVGVFRLPFKRLRDWTAFLLSLTYAVLITLLFQKILRGLP